MLKLEALSSSKNVTRSDNATCFIVPLSLQTNLSVAARVVDVAEVPPSIKFNSAVVEVIPSSTFNSVTVDVKLVSLVTGKVPVMELAARSIANSVDSITSPPLAFKSRESVLPDLSKPLPLVIELPPENCVNVNPVVPIVILPSVDNTQPVSA